MKILIPYSAYLKVCPSIPSILLPVMSRQTQYIYIYIYIYICVCVWGERERERERERSVTLGIMVNVVGTGYSGNLLSFLLRCGTRPYEWGTQ